MKIDVVRVPDRRQFVQVDLRTARDPRLSWKARGMLMWLLSHAAGFQSSPEGIRQASAQDGDYAVRQGLRELEEAGYLDRTRSRTADGRWCHVVTVREEPTGGWPDAVIAPGSIDHTAVSASTHTAVIAPNHTAETAACSAVDQVLEEQLLSASAHASTAPPPTGTTPRSTGPSTTPSEQQSQHGRGKGMTDATVRNEWEAFTNHHQARGTKIKDWDAAWRTWCANWVRYGARQVGQQTDRAGRPVVPFGRAGRNGNA